MIIKITKNLFGNVSLELLSAGEHEEGDETASAGISLLHDSENTVSQGDSVGLGESSAFPPSKTGGMYLTLKSPEILKTSYKIKIRRWQ